jgi:hypothetical protein
MTTQEPFHDFVGRPSRLALRGIVPVALVHDVDLVARRCRIVPVVRGIGRDVGGLTHKIRLRFRRRRGKGWRQRRLPLQFLLQQPPAPVMNASDSDDQVVLLDELLDANIEQAVVIRHVHDGVAELL